MIRSELSSWVGGVPGGTMMVGSLPAVPAGERSATGTVAIVAAIAGAALVVAVVVGALVDEELLQSR